MKNRSIIEFQQVTYVYPERTQPALKDVSLSIDAGEFILVCGASGSGKSTLLRAINGLVPHFHGGRWSGEVVVAGHKVTETHPRDLAAKVGFVFQDPDAQFVVEVVEDELAFAMENAGVPQHLMRRRIEEALDQVEIAHLRHRVITSLSGGERQRVAIAAALTTQPDILVLDEPTSQLDPHTAEEVLTALQKLNADLGLTIVLSEHRLERVVQYVDRILWMRGGVQQLDEPRAILRHMPEPPPLIAVGQYFDWQPLPLTIKQGRRWSTMIDVPAILPTLKPRGSVAIQVKNIHASYDRVSVLRRINLTAHQGEVVAIMGRNGSGKTTLLRHLVGLQQPDQGQVLLHGHPIKGREVEELAQTIGYVPQNPGDILFKDTLRAELAFTLNNHDQPITEQQIHKTLAQLGIAELAEMHPRDLSGGEAGRAALAAILVAEPEILLLDEPTRGLDYGSKQQLADLLNELSRRQHCILVVTHDVEFVALCADRVVLLGDGEVVVDGLPHEVLGESLLFSTQVGKLFPGSGWLTVHDVRAHVTLP